MIIRFDIYKHNPWRAPGSAPVLDACGLAGGTPWGGDVAEWGGFHLELITFVTIIANSTYSPLIVIIRPAKIIAINRD